ncbi:hypothetical protein LA080_005290 [Diaporthe eres]|nr:hypothetical protein LA080_005290 [Diaporthe eres]
MTVSTFASICNRYTHVLVKYPSFLDANCLETACVSSPPSSVPPREPEDVLTGFQGEAHVANHHTSVRLPLVFPSSPATNVHTISSKKKQPEPSPTTLRHKAACFFSGLPRSLPSSARLAYGLAGWRTTGTQCHTRANIFTTPSSARVVHPSIIIPLAGQRWGDVSGTLPVVLIGLDRLHQVMGRLQASSAEPNRKSYQ